MPKLPHRLLPLLHSSTLAMDGVNLVLDVSRCWARPPLSPQNFRRIVGRVHPPVGLHDLRPVWAGRKHITAVPDLRRHWGAKRRSMASAHQLRWWKKPKPCVKGLGVTRQWTTIQSQALQFALPGNLRDPMLPRPSKQHTGCKAWTRRIRQRYSPHVACNLGHWCHPRDHHRQTAPGLE